MTTGSSTEAVAVYDWQRALGWIVASAYAWQFVVHPVLVTAAAAYGVSLPPTEALNLTEAGALVGGALGLAWLKRAQGTG